MLDFPEPDGPETTRSRAATTSGELGSESLFLLVSQALILRFSAMPSDSIKRFALIFPVPGIDAMTRSTFNPARMSSLSALSINSESRSDPVFKSSLASARTLLASAALASAAVLCSSVNWGGWAMSSSRSPNGDPSQRCRRRRPKRGRDLLRDRLCRLNRIGRSRDRAAYDEQVRPLL